METWGIIIMFIMIAISNAGGISGAASVIPVMLIFYGLEIDQIVPISSFVAVVATVLRFIINFK